MSEIRVENWQGYEIRFVKVRDEWYAILKDICDALGLRTAGVAQRLDPNMMERVPVQIASSVPKRYGEKDEVISNDVNFSSRFTKTIHMLAINEIGIYEALFASRRLEARKFRIWSATVLQKLRSQIGLEQYEVMRMTEPEIQKDINHMLDDIFYDESTGMLMQSVTVAGGDVEQVPLFDE